MPLNKDGDYEPPRWFAWVQRAQFMPKLPLRAWWTIWALAMLTFMGNLLGRVLGWWERDDSVGYGTSLIFALLAFTPMDFPPSVFWMARAQLPDGSWMDWGDVAPQGVEELKGMRGVQLRRVTIKDGRIVEDTRIQ